MTLLTWELLRRVFTVDTIMTPRQELLTWERGTDVLAVRVAASQRGFDLIPATEGAYVVGILCGDPLESKPLTHRWLVSRDTEIPGLLTLFVESEQPGLLVLHRQDVIGLVTPADLNKLPARVYFYNLIGELELALAACVRRHFRDDGAVLSKLSEKRRKELEEQHRIQTEGNVDIDIVQQLYLSDLINIVEKADGLRSQLGFSSRREAHNPLGGLNDLRDQTMHPVRLLLTRVPEDLLKLHERLRRARDVIQSLNEWTLTH